MPPQLDHAGTRRYRNQQRLYDMLYALETEYPHGQPGGVHRFDHQKLVAPRRVDAIGALGTQHVLQPLGVRQPAIAAAQHAAQLRV